ncbi:amidohydrolase family protein [Nocardia amikacinitolerans]|uniref:amidohydrolase family protein n=1 Tax=Nocardia amikacinitolerans TaxID=756689 RepID=UPI0020A49B5E|nr:amidohydrolase family protein [Nocardia amikacinitolerans]MCP2280294.1 Imidazolonepropionase [Nocardia amikacinitolerans]MCP2299570.1 Imidazolonepropionase [Nocardia amikacinitolerans]
MHLRGVVLPDDEVRDLWVHEGLVSFDPVPGAETLCTAGWIVPGLVDAHCHVGIRYGGGDETREGAIAQAVTERDAGALLLRDAGSPIDTRFVDEYQELPKIIRAGRHIARPKRYIRELGIELDDERDLPEIVAEQARFGDGWVKIVGDWIDRSVGDLRPLWSDAILKEAIDAAHANGARVTAHVFGEDALPGLIDAGIDCIEHGTGLTDETIEMMVEHGTALVPTMINIDTFPSIADSAGKFPVYAAHMRDLHRRVRQTVAAAHDAGVPIYTGTDAGGSIRHGRIADEIIALTGAGLSAHDALGAASWNARTWLDRPGIEHGAPADLVVYREDPRLAPATLSAPEYVVLRGRVYCSADPVTGHR